MPGTRNAQQQNDPGLSSWDITPDDAADVPVTRGLSSNDGGIVRVLFVNDEAPVDRLMIAGYMYGWSVKRVYETGTTPDMHVAGYR